MRYSLPHGSIATLVVVGLALSGPSAWSQESLVGTYAATLHVEDVKIPAGSEIPTAQIAGEWSVAFGADHTYSVKQNNIEQVTGTYTLQGDELELTDTSGEFACKGGDAPQGVYRVKLDGPALTFTKVKDEECAGRVATITAKPFQRVQ
jgi:hypothetical protein